MQAQVSLLKNLGCSDFVVQHQLLLLMEALDIFVIGFGGQALLQVCMQVFSDEKQVRLCFFLFAWQWDLGRPVILQVWTTGNNS